MSDPVYVPVRWVAERVVQRWREQCRRERDDAVAGRFEGHICERCFEEPATDDEWGAWLCEDCAEATDVENGDEEAARLSDADEDIPH